ncbi:MAG: Arm DNA-binding domain-containing protein [Leptolyngbyaceae cyanobacterium]
MPKSKKGTVVVRVVTDRLRLIWSFCGQRYFFTLGLTDTKANRAIAALKATKIQRDIASDLFNLT